MGKKMPQTKPSKAAAAYELGSPPPDFATATDRACERSERRIR